MDNPILIHTDLLSSILPHGDEQNYALIKKISYPHSLSFSLTDCSLLLFGERINNIIPIFFCPVHYLDILILFRLFMCSPQLTAPVVQSLHAFYNMNNFHLFHDTSLCSTLINYGLYPF